MVSFSYLNPFLEKIFKPYERYQRMVVQLTLLYMCFLIFLLHHVFIEQFNSNLEARHWKRDLGFP
jgi:hypothetical protein